ncbi:multidrug effflux MFS transporter [Shimia sp. MMG029]|uniref:multidrug effflux MFS transporter n=1 Tax=Shimia sp. MMG029 TaxID=3021978 RepID=UPI0022FE4EA0|nr:multidrug effflux MFS transporter [Shimia sp. MMG029]MDA5556412.1 multidrug effflux MFS transporter [Shimia sp. MMG029]
MTSSATLSPPHLNTLVLLTAMSVLSLNMFLPSMAAIAAEFSVPYAVANLSLGGFLAITVVLQVVIGPLSDRYGRRPVMLSGLAIFALGSAGCLWADSITGFLFWRMLQAAGVVGIALSRAVVRDMHGPQEAASKLGYISMVMAIAPMLGPTLGGLLHESFGWRASFVLYLLMGVGLLALCWRDLGETNTDRAATMREQFATYPALLKSRRFWGYSLCIGFSVGAFYVHITGSVLVGAEVFGLSPAAVGMSVGTIAIGFSFGSFLSGKLAPRLPLWVLVLSGRIVGLVGLCIGLTIVLFGFIHPVTFTGAVIFVGIGNGLTLPSANSGAMSVRPKLAGSASGLSGAMSVGIGAVMTSVTGAILTPANGVYLMYGLMIGCGVISLITAVYVRWLDITEPLDDTPKAA